MHSLVRGRRGVAAVMAGLACCLVAGAGAPAGAVPGAPGPSADEVAEARSEARERDRRLGEVTVMAAEAQARLSELAAEAEKLVEAYNGEVVRTARAKEAYEQANLRAETARAEVDLARQSVVALATQSYGSLDMTQPMMAIAADGGGAQGYLHRASVLAHMGGGQAETLNRLRDSQEVLTILSGQAEDAYAEQREAQERAAEAKRAAEEAVAAQVAETRRVQEEQARLEKLADAARDTAERLARQREEALEKARAAEESTRYRGLQAVALRRDTARMRVAQGASVSRWALNATARASRGDIAADWALTQLDKPYVWAAAGPGAYDCSGLTMRAWEQVGVGLDHWTGTQWTAGPHVRLSELRRGDLLFFGEITGNPGDIHHVGIYIGEGLMVHAPQTGDVVRVAPIWRRDLVGATRPA
ncbi:cell wall-associated NlpC family hydrolase [Streptosporangium becharense]|uniref:Cell wall-associated NlpC family hydrolase n=1 Tax=Streptosporangium becharense TaxID=1816182 RepID=A0A7W9II81_9ACTN|nr:NlpC/P60 family protein [Streptosporangium becharense]MBB2912572.1 cell wall-associated NlpC family hydrolase [Streptosporangium becharense]MBB5820598.1 cell wall-associated NlpC family hydrolase [Streptosporangium becharense]